MSQEDPYDFDGFNSLRNALSSALDGKPVGTTMMIDELLAMLPEDVELARKLTAIYQVACRRLRERFKVKWSDGSLGELTLEEMLKATEDGMIEDKVSGEIRLDPGSFIYPFFEVVGGI